MSENRHQIFVFDVDGTLALHQGRGPYEWQRGSHDLPNSPVIAVLHALASAGHGIAYISGRPEGSRRLTAEWISMNVGVEGPLFLRADLDYRKDSEVKLEIYRKSIEPNYRVLAIFDDRDQVVVMWRSLGLPCFQVAGGNF